MAEQPGRPQKRTPAAKSEPPVQELQAEVDALRRQLDRREGWARRRKRLRRIGAGILVVLFSVTAVAATIGVWARDTALDTDDFVDAVGPLPDNDAVAAALAAFLTEETFAVLDLEGRAEEALPDDLDFLAAPLVAAVEDFVQERVDVFLETSEFDRIWREAVRLAHESAIKVLRDESDVVVTEDGEVVLDLLPIVNQVLERVADRFPEVFGQQVSFPDVTDDTTRRELREGIEDALGVELPEDFGQIPIFNEDKLSEAQDAVQLVDRFVIALVVLTLLFGGGALALSVDRRRTGFQLGLGVAVATYLVFTVLRRVVADLVDLIPSDQNQDAVRAAARIVADGLRDRAWLVLIAGAIVAVATYLAGPGRGAAWVRGSAVRGVGLVRERGATLPSTPTGHWIQVNLDALRIGGLAAGLVVLIVMHASWFGLFVVLALVTAYEIGVTTIARRATPEAAP